MCNIMSVFWTLSRRAAFGYTAYRPCIRMRHVSNAFKIMSPSSMHPNTVQKLHTADDADVAPVGLFRGKHLGFPLQVRTNLKCKFICKRLGSSWAPEHWWGSWGSMPIDDTNMGQRFSHNTCPIEWRHDDAHTTAITCGFFCRGETNQHFFPRTTQTQ